MRGTKLVPVALATVVVALGARSAPGRTQSLTNPPGRIEAGMAYDAARRQVVLFGGLDSSQFSLGDTWTWDGTTWTERHPQSSPSPRYGAHMAYDAARREVVLFGGSAGSDET